MEYTRATLPDKMLCPELNIARLACLNPNCQQPNFSCMKQTCKSCYQSHVNCKLTHAKGLLENIKSKKQQLTPKHAKAMRMMENIYQEQIENLFQRKQSMATQMGYFGLNPYQAELFKMIQQGRTQQITGKSIMSNIAENMFLKQEFLATQQIVLKQWKKRRAQFEELLQKMRKLQILGMIRLDSKITEDFETISSFFQDMPKILKTKLLFRASENQFSAQKFHNSCDGISNTLVIIQTEFGKIIGGFTPLPWNISGGYSNDFKRQTFLFSLTNRQKYDLVNTHQAIFGDISCGPTFGGGHDIYIANGNRKNNSRINHQDEEDDYSQNQQESYFNFPHSFLYKGILSKSRNNAYENFTGQTNGDYYCAVKEYEVFQIQFLS